MLEAAHHAAFLQRGGPKSTRNLFRKALQTHAPGERELSVLAETPMEVAVVPFEDFCDIFLGTSTSVSVCVSLCVCARAVVNSGCSARLQCHSSLSHTATVTSPPWFATPQTWPTTHVSLLSPLALSCRSHQPPAVP